MLIRRTALSTKPDHLLYSSALCLSSCSQVQLERRHQHFVTVRVHHIVPSCCILPYYNGVLYLSLDALMHVLDQAVFCPLVMINVDVVVYESAAVFASGIRPFG